MNTNSRTIFFWISVTTIALLSIILSFYNTNSTIATTISLPGFQVTFIKRVVENSGIYELFSFISQISGHHHHHHHHHQKVACVNKWNSSLVSEYRVSLVLTVDQEGCGNFSSLQQAVDAVPDSSVGATLIILDSGTYR